MNTAHRIRIINGHQIHVVETGDPRSPVIVMLHGIGVSERYFRPLMVELAGEFRILAPDLPGFGRSPNPGRRMTIQDYAGLVVELLEQESIDAPALVGHSMGCQIAAEIACRRPGMIRRIILIGPTIDKFRRRIRSQALRLFTDGLVDPLRATAVVLSDYLRCNPRHYLRTVRPMMVDRIEEQVAACSAEVLIVRGKRDPIAPHGWATYLADVAPHGSLVEVAGAGHVVQYAKAAEVAANIRRFVQP